MKNIPLIWTLGMIVTTPFFVYLLLPFFMIFMLNPPGTKSGSYIEELKNPKTSQHYLDRGNFALDKPTNKQDVKKALVDCEIAEKLALSEKYVYYSDTFLCQALAHAYLGDFALARKLVARSIAMLRQDGHQDLADTQESLHKRLIQKIEAKKPLPEEPSPYGFY